MSLPTPKLQGTSFTVSTSLKVGQNGRWKDKGYDPYLAGFSRRRPAAVPAFDGPILSK
jgi:hypothetical protein